MGDLTEQESRDLFNLYTDKKAARIQHYLSRKPSPKAFGIGDKVVVTWPGSKYFGKRGEVSDLNYLPSSASKGYGDYSVTVDFSGGITRKFLQGRVRSARTFRLGKNTKWLRQKARGYKKSQRRREATKKLENSLTETYGTDWYTSREAIGDYTQGRQEIEKKMRSPLEKRCEREGLPPTLLTRFTKEDPVIVELEE